MMASLLEVLEELEVLDNCENECVASFLCIDEKERTNREKDGKKREAW